MKKSSSALVPMFVVFLLVNAICIFFADWLDAHEINHVVVGLANCILFIVSLIIYSMHQKSAQNANPHAFVRSVMGGTLIKLFVFAGGALLYLYFAGENKSVYAVVAAMGLYLVYTAIEVGSAMHLNKKDG